MYIKAFSSKKHQKQMTMTIQSKRPKYFQIPLIQDRTFTDDLWFQRQGVMPHVQNHRPLVKRRMLKLNDQSRNIYNLKQRSARESRVEIAKNIYTPTLKTRVQVKKQQISCNANNKYIAIKETIIRQMSQIPDYARNIMKPCKIQAITISQRPQTARKPTSASKMWRHRNSEKFAFRKKDLTQEEGGNTISHDLYSVFRNCQAKIQPWEQREQQFTIY